ncbi:MAG: hypothetical protein ACPGYT_04385 [Nitrospirales bacterium]
MKKPLPFQCGNGPSTNATLKTFPLLITARPMKRNIFHIIMSCSWLFILAWPPYLYSAIDSDEEVRLPLAMEVFLKKPEKREYVIHIHLTNISEQPVIVDVHDLPWNPPNDSKWLLAFQMNERNNPIKQQTQRWDFGSQEVRLLPGESIQGKLALNLRIPSLLSHVDQFGVQLDWDCPPASLKFVCKAGTPHRITIPKGDPGQADVLHTNQQVCLTKGNAIGLISIPLGHEILFLRTSVSVMAEITKMQSLLYQVDTYVRECQPKWTNSWSVNFFTDEKFAGFLKDVENEDYFKNGLWQQANIGQYSSQIRTLFRFPWTKKKSDTVYISVFR